MTSEDPIVAALLRERAAMQTHGKKDRVAAVDAELKARGYTGKAAASAEPLEPEDPPKGRSSRKAETA